MDVHNNIPVTSEHLESSHIFIEDNSVNESNTSSGESTSDILLETSHNNMLGEPNDHVSVSVSGSESPSDPTKSQISALNIITLPELENMLPMPSEMELAQLKESIQTNGILDPISLWNRDDGTHVVVDGHNRLRICTELGIQPKVRMIPFSSLEEVIEWALRIQMGRRNLSDAIRISYALKLVELQKQNAAAFKLKSLKTKNVANLPELNLDDQESIDSVSSELSSATESPRLRTRDKVAMIADVSARTVQSFQTVISKGTEEQKHRLMDKGIAISKLAKEVLKNERDSKNKVNKVRNSTELKHKLSAQSVGTTNSELLDVSIPSDALGKNNPTNDTLVMESAISKTPFVTYQINPLLEILYSTTPNSGIPILEEKSTSAIILTPLSLSDYDFPAIAKSVASNLKIDSRLLVYTDPKYIHAICLAMNDWFGYLSMYPRLQQMPSDRFIEGVNTESWSALMIFAKSKYDLLSERDPLLGSKLMSGRAMPDGTDTTESELLSFLGTNNRKHILLINPNERLLQSSVGLKERVTAITYSKLIVERFKVSE